ncbi:MAG: Nif3-like dinuclear metal center hexameric protein [Bacteroidales bacterium]
MKNGEIIRFIEQHIPPALQESYDNSGLQAGTYVDEAKAALLAFDVTEQVIDEALLHGCNLVISHHPVIFSPLKRLSDTTSTERVIMKAVRNGITIYSAHTSLDSVYGGVSFKLAERIGLINVEVLSPVREKLLKLVAFVPSGYIGKVRDAVFEAGAGHIGNYDSCAYYLSGEGSFRGNEDSEPFTGKKGELHFEPETRFETILPAYLKNAVVKALVESHPYEEPAFDIYPLMNEWQGAGLGAIGTLSDELPEQEFLKQCNTALNPACLRHTSLSGRMIKRVAVCGGSGSSLISAAVSRGADALVTGDIKYHQFFGAAGELLLVDAGHYETEKFAMEIIYDMLIKKFPNFALRFSETDTNPINCY